MNAPVSLIHRLVRATVGLEAKVPESHPSAAILGSERSGTGTLIDQGGLVLTVNYVVLGADEIEVTLAGGETYPGRVVAQDFCSGVGVLQIEGGAPHRFASLRSARECEVGEEVVIVASLGGDKRRANNGCIAAIDPFDAYWEYQLDRAIYSTAVNPGLGGAPLFDVRGNMIGIVALDLGEIGRFTLAIPTEFFTDHRDELLSFGHRRNQTARAWVGLYCYTHRDRVVIAGVLPASPAESAGLRAGDVVLALNDQPVSTRAGLYGKLWENAPGTRLTFQVYRKNEILHIEVAARSVEEFFA